jgi:hypothetical protein
MSKKRTTTESGQALFDQLRREALLNAFTGLSETDQ